jgi:transcriptional regulator with PAS, ATPase and Fis domain
VAGAFTGADRKGREGKFRLADGGTLFLDEIGDMPLPLQAKLLRALQEGEMEPLGSNHLVQFDVRILAATSRDLLGMVRSGKFREDLYYRLNVLPVRVPALRERRTDIPALVEVLGEDIALRSGVPQPEFSAAAVDLLCAQAWRGNVRELRNILEQLMMCSDARQISAEEVMRVLNEGGQAVPEWTAPVLAAPARLIRPMADAVAELEAQLISQALEATQGNRVAAAAALGISRATLYDRLAKMSELKPTT